MSTTFDVVSADGTRIRCWRSGGDGVPLVIANGLGTIPEAWPRLVAQDSGYRALTWYQRGTFGSERPRDRTRIRVEDHVDDLVALMDDQGIDAALVACWSLGVNVAFEMCQRHPERVSGLLAVAGVPGGTFATMGAPWRIPRQLRRPIATGVAKAMRETAGWLTWLSPRIPVDARTAWVLRHSGFLSPRAAPEQLVPMLRQFLRQDWKWYGELAVAASEHQPMDLAFVQCPVTIVAGKRDLLTSMQDVVDAAARIPHAQISVLPGSHFLPLEFPDELHALLDDLAQRARTA